MEAHDGSATSADARSVNARATKPASTGAAGASGRLTRRSLLAGAARSVAGGALGLSVSAIDSSLASGAARPAAGGSVSREPPAPAGAMHFVSRPDLTPVGVSIRSTPQARSATSDGHTYIFCAPKAALAPFPRGATPGLMIIDTDGELVYFKPLPALTQVPFNFQVQRYRGKPVLTWFQGTTGLGYATAGEYVLADSTYQPIARLAGNRYPPDLHEFVLTPDGHALHSAYEVSTTVTFKKVPVLISHVQEVDVATGQLIFDWPCYPAIGFGASYLGPTFGTFDYFHLNSIDRWPGHGRNLLIGARSTCAVYLLNQQTGRITWQLGGKRSNFALKRGVRFWYEHDARALPDGSGLSVFDDASLFPAARAPSERYASGKVITLDQHTRTASLRHQYLHTDKRFRALNQGNCQRLKNGAHMIGWGSQPFFSLYTPGPSDAPSAPLVLDGRLPRGAQSYRCFASAWRGAPPLSELAIAVRRVGATHTVRAYLSWNGATEVARWRLYAGRSSRRLEPVSVLKRSGFETVIPVHQGGLRYFQAAALDARNRILGRTQTVRLK